MLKENWRWKDQQEAVLSMCSSLIVVVDEQSIPGVVRRVVQFSHFSVKEFLTSDRLATSGADISPFHILSGSAHAVIVKACLGILLQSEQGPHDATDERLSPSPLFNYAAQCWVGHARFDELWRLVETEIRSLFDPGKPHLEGWLGFYDSGYFPGFALKEYRGSPLYYASLCGFRGLTAQLIAENPQHVTGQVGRNPTPLVAALCGSYFDIADLLYQAGADICIRGDGDITLLQAASSGGYVDVANWLFDHGVSAKNTHNKHTGNIINVNAMDDIDNTPLRLASKGGHSEMVEQLLIHGADDINVQDGSHRTALHLASESTSWASADCVCLDPSQG